MDVAKSELEIYKNQYETAVDQLKEAKDNLNNALETRTHRKRYQLVQNFYNVHVRHFHV